jgi:RNA polymerase sigma-70 factor (ECF subfamily)
MDPGGAPPEPSRREALSKALLEEGDRLYALALRVTRDPDLAADAVQEAFATALERESGFRGESSLATWLHRIVYTKSIDLLRIRGREAPLPEEEDQGREPPREDLGREPAWARPPDALLLGRETRAALEKALGALTPGQRAIFELKEVEGRPTEEVGAILGMPPGTVRVHLHRARLKLRALLSEHFRRGRA